MVITSQKNSGENIYHIIILYIVGIHYVAVAFIFYFKIKAIQLEMRGQTLLNPIPLKNN